MHIPSSFREQRESLIQLGELERDEREQWERLRAEEQRRLDQLLQQADMRRQQIQDAGQQQLQRLEAEYTTELERQRLSYEQALERLNDERNRLSDQNAAARSEQLARAKRDAEDRKCQILGAYQQDRRDVLESYQQFRHRWLKEQEVVAGAIRTAHRVFARRGFELTLPSPAAAPTALPGEKLVRRVDAAVARLVRLQHQVQRHRATRFLDQGWVLLLFLLLAFAAVYPAGLLAEFRIFPWLTATVAASLVPTLMLLVPLRGLAREQARRRVPAALRAIAMAQAAYRAAPVAARREAEKRLKGLLKACNAELALVDQQCTLQMEQIEKEFARRLESLERNFTRHQQSLRENWQQQSQACHNEHQPRIEHARQQLARQLSALDQHHRAQRDQWTTFCQSQSEQLAKRWSAAVQAVERAARSAEEYCRRYQPDLESVDWSQWIPPTRAAPIVRIGGFLVALQNRDRHASDDGLPCRRSTIEFPLLLSFPETPSLVLLVDQEARQIAHHVMQQAMLRLLTSLPPGKVRFTIIDPSSLGQSFSAFMHLADFDPRLVSSRIWTEAAHIQQRLTDVTEHMEDIIQKYLRNEFTSLEEYNEQAGDIAEPYHVLVVANFPANFTDEAARRLLSIAASGPRCGVAVVISVDRKQKLPRQLPLADLCAHAVTLAWQHDRFTFHDDALASLPVSLEMPPSDRELTAILKAVGRYATDAHRVAVPFSTVVPDESTWWSHDSADALRVPLGRTGATRLLNLQLGLGTAQHVLIAGKTGSGKSTLLHALVTNLSIHYAPDQLEFYLIDFKKGVEFKDYAVYRLPHARVIAIESEREFGISVLEHLDRELARRGELFRETGVQNLGAYRQAQTGKPLPRVLLIVDEFQEFFVKDDKIAQQASLLLDRLVRQGRAFGLHVVLGSQTLAGAYSLARSTIGQMAVRIALPCSAADAHLILSEENTAARLLHRPGEAIYNDAGGLFEANHPFQVVWLPESQRRHYLMRMTEFTQVRSLVCDPPIVFEGNAAARLADNRLLRQRLLDGPGDQVDLGPTAWVGEPVTIDQPCSVQFRRQGASNLLVVGASRELADGALASCAISLTVGQPADSQQPNKRRVSLWVLDGITDGQSGLDVWRDVLGCLPAHLDLAVPGDERQLVARLAGALTGRMAQPRVVGDPIFLIIRDLARFRDLRPAEDEFRLGSFTEQPTSASDQLAQVIREGPPVGIHTIIWSDSWSTVARWLARPLLREFAWRVLFQMNAMDSSNLMDSAAASQLGPWRAILYRDDLGQQNRFRPYALPDPDWLAGAAQRLAERRDRGPRRKPVAAVPPTPNTGSATARQKPPA